MSVQQGDGAMTDIIAIACGYARLPEAAQAACALEPEPSFIHRNRAPALLSGGSRQPNDVPRFLFQGWALGQFKDACQVRFYIVDGPYTLDAGR